MVGMTLNDLYTKVKVTHFGINGFLIYDFQVTFALGHTV